MKAMVYQQYGSPDDLELREVSLPSLVGDEVLVKVQAASVNWLDLHFLTGSPFLVRLMAGLLKPKNNILGIDFSGRVETISASVTQVQPGDEVFGSTSHGCFAEYVSVPLDRLQRKPSNITFEAAAAAGAAASVALQGLRDAGQVKTGQTVAINGASGGVGTFALQLAKAFGTEVTGICSGRNLDLLRSIGADHVVDYTEEDFTQDGRHFDLIFDTVAKLSFSDCRRVLKSEGMYVTTEFSPILALKGLWISSREDKRMVPLQPKPPSPPDQAYVRELLEAGTIKPVIDRHYSLAELPEAFHYLEGGHARGKIVITM